MTAAVGTTAGIQTVSAQETTPENQTAGGETTETENGSEVGPPFEPIGDNSGMETRALIIPPERWERSIEGYFVHAGGEVDPLDAAGSDKCEFADWPDDQSRAYDVTLIDRVELLESAESSTLYVPNDVDIPAGGLFMIESVEQCPSNYNGIRIRQLGIKNLPTGEEASSTPDATSGEQAPGFGVLAGLAGLAGAIGASKLRDTETE